MNLYFSGTAEEMGEAILLLKLMNYRAGSLCYAEPKAEGSILIMKHRLPRPLGRVYYCLDKPAAEKDKRITLDELKRALRKSARRKKF